MSSFGGLNTALSGLLAHKRSIDVIGHNISNVNTEGYSRRRVQLQPSVGLVSPTRFNTGVTSNNLGVDVKSVDRIRDLYLDVKARTEFGNEASASTLESMLGRIEGIFPEPADNALAGQLSAFWNAFADAANNPSSAASRSALLAQASTLVNSFSKASSELTSLHRELASNAAMTVSEINAAATQVAALNGQIRLANAAGADAGDLADQRDVLIDRLAAATGATTRPGDNGQMDVILGGMELVHGNKAEALKLVTGGSLPSPLNTLPVQKTELRWESDNYAVVGYGGTLGATVQGLNDVVPRYMQDLNTMAASLVTTTNAVHTTGQGTNPTTDINLNFFDPAGLTAGTLALSSDVAGQPSRIALGAVGGGALDGSVGHALGALGSAAGGPDALHRTMMGRLGVEAQTAGSRASLQSRIAAEADNQRLAVSGVNLDEEMTNLVMSQRAYESAARLLTTIDEMLETLITRTGVVGR